MCAFTENGERQRGREGGFLVNPNRLCSIPHNLPSSGAPTALSTLVLLFQEGPCWVISVWAHQQKKGPPCEAGAACLLQTEQHQCHTPKIAPEAFLSLVACQEQSSLSSWKPQLKRPTQLLLFLCSRFDLTEGISRPGSWGAQCHLRCEHSSPLIQTCQALPVLPQ